MWGGTLAMVLGLAAPVSAWAATESVNQSSPAPLGFSVTDTGQHQVWVKQSNGTINSQWYGSVANGPVIWLDGASTAQRYSGGYVGGTVITQASNTKSGTGTVVDPYVITTVANVGTTGVQFTQRISYVNGDRTLRLNWSLKNNSATTTFNDLRYMYGGDITMNGSDRGLSWYDPVGSMVYASSVEVPRVSSYMGFRANPATPASAYYVGQYSTGNSQAAAGQLLNQVYPASPPAGPITTANLSSFNNPSGL